MHSDKYKNLNSTNLKMQSDTKNKLVHNHILYFTKTVIINKSTILLFVLVD